MALKVEEESNKRVGDAGAVYAIVAVGVDGDEALV